MSQPKHDLPPIPDRLDWLLDVACVTPEEYKEAEHLMIEHIATYRIVLVRALSACKIIPGASDAIITEAKPNA